MLRSILAVGTLILSVPSWADADDWGGWGVLSPPMIAVTPPAIVLPQINISPVPLWAPPPVVYYGPRYGYAPYGYSERHHGHGGRHHHHDRD
jgi:hypothetical protein